MARKIVVLEAHSTSIARYAKKTVALLMIRRLLWVWVVKGYTARILPLGEIPAEARNIRLPIDSNPYLPTRMPPADVGGCHFQEPQSDTWQRQHRSVALIGPGQHPYICGGKATPAC